MLIYKDRDTSHNLSKQITEKPTQILLCELLLLHTSVDYNFLTLQMIVFSYFTL